MYSSLMSSFDFVVPIHHIHAIFSESSSLMRFVPFRTLYFNDPWTVPSLTMSYKGKLHIGMEMPLFTTKNTYHSIIVEMPLVIVDLHMHNKEVVNT
jgi:hypothetical protein